MELMVTYDENKKLEFSERLNSALDAAGFPVRGRAQRIIERLPFGISVNGVRKWLEGDAIPATTRLSAIAEIANTTKNWLMDGELPADSLNTERSTESIDKPILINIPYHHTAKAKLQPPAPTFSKLWLDQLGLKPSSLVVVQCLGTSMEPNIRNGDIVLINTACKEIEDNKIYAVDYAGDAKILRLVKRYDGSLIIRSDNPSPEYQDEVVPENLTHLIKIIGRAVWVSGML